MTLEILIQKTAKIYEDFYSSDKITELCKTFKSSPTCQTNAPMEALVKLCEAQSIGLNLNAVRYTDRKQLSKNNRINITRNGDVFENITIQCFDPSEIEEVTLCAGVILPSPLSFVNCDTFDFNNLEPYYSSDPRPHETHYFPIKTIRHPKSNVVSFYDNPLLMMAEIYSILSIEVKYVKDYPNPDAATARAAYNQKRNVELNYLILDTELRNNIAHNHTRYTQNNQNNQKLPL